MWHQWFNYNFMKVLEYFLCTNKTKITTSYLPSQSLMRVYMSTMTHTCGAAVARSSFAGKDKWCSIWTQSKRFNIDSNTFSLLLCFCPKFVAAIKIKKYIYIYKIHLCHNNSRRDWHGNVHDIVNMFDLGGINLLCCCYMRLSRYWELLLPINTSITCCCEHVWNTAAAHTV